MAYALKTPEGPLALTGLLPVDVLINGARNTINLAREPGLRDHIFRLFSTNHSPQSRAATLRELLCCLPKVEAPESWTSASLFRVIIMQFIDAWSFDVRSIKKTCVHIVHPDGRLIPFDTYNLFYRDGLERSRLVPLRQRADLGIEGGTM